MAVNLRDNDTLKRRSAGVLLPLFSMRSASDWGCGDMASFKEWISYLCGEGVRLIQILPIHETTPYENCPYSALSAYAFDPVYISVEDVPDVRASLEAQDIIASIREEINYWREQKTLQLKYIKSAKYKVMYAAYEYFLGEEQSKNTPRYNDFLEFQKNNNHWLVPYTIFRTAKDLTGWASWKHWENSFKNTEVAFLKNFAAQHSKQMMFFSYLQWVIRRQLD
ncbi:MAG: 4-alpha-glucanotransferase, partial [Elusimicrobiota bacterium]|nr:4-alpha-glucanotransferase [Elusimicrobiota bacterium]